MVFEFRAEPFSDLRVLHKVFKKVRKTSSLFRFHLSAQCMHYLSAAACSPERHCVFAVCSNYNA